MDNLTPIPGARLLLNDDGEPIIRVATCGTCGRSWNDAEVSDWTPAPAGRCPFEDEHEHDDAPVRSGMSDEVRSTILTALDRYAEEICEEARTATLERRCEIAAEDERIEAAEWFTRRYGRATRLADEMFGMDGGAR